MIHMSDNRLRSHVEKFRDKHAIPALGAGIITRDGHLDVVVTGERVRGGSEPVRPDDRWHIGSCGKSITAALFARLVERGAAEWGTSLVDLFPDLDVHIDQGWNAITVDDVFVCQAGLPANLTKSELLAGFRDVRRLREQRTAVAAKALARPPRQPGRFLYSNLGYILIGAAIERITAQPFEAALQTHVLEPLGITSGGFGPPAHVWGHGGRMVALGAFGMMDLGRGEPADPEQAESDNPAVMSPAGRLHLTLEDWSRFHRMFLLDGGDFLRPESIERLLAPAPGRGHRMSPGWGMVRAKGDASIGQQGSNTRWVATAIMDRRRGRTAMVACNDGRSRLLGSTFKLALQLLTRGC